MGVLALVPTSRTLDIGDVWTLLVFVQDDDSNYASTAPTATITTPAGTTATPTMTDQGGGCWRAQYTILATGRHVAKVLAAGIGAESFTAYVTTTTPASAMPVLADVKTYLGTTSFTDAEITDALNAEAAAQRRLCRVPADYPDDLAQALKRRVARNLAMRSLPLAVLRGDSDGGDSSILPGRDPEIRRLEGGYRKVVLG